MLEGYIEALQLQSDVCDRLAAPLTGEVVRIAAKNADQGGPFAEAGRSWSGRSLAEVTDDAVALRLTAAVHALVLADRAPDLAAAYAAGRVDDPQAFADALLAAAAREGAFIADFMRSPPQTNEVRRSLALVGGFLTVMAQTGLPLRTFEIGASAGLNLSWDRYRYSFSEGAEWGDPSSALHLAGDWKGAPPPLPPYQLVAERAACDIAPLDVRDPAQFVRLQAYVWPEQPDRLERLRTAAAIAVANDVRVERADAPNWVAERVAPQRGFATVLYHSVMRQYLPQTSRERLDAAIAAAAAQATADAPFAHLSMEAPDRQALQPHEVRLRLWPGGEERLLARVHPHGAMVAWLPEA